MSRNAFGTWGLGLSPREFGAALAALGVRQGDFSPESGSWENSRPVDEIVKGGEKNRIPWRIDTEAANLAIEPLPDAAALAKEWDRALDARANPERSPVRLKIDPRPHFAGITPWIIRQLVNFARADAVSIDEITLPSFVHWSWPLQIGVMPGPGAAALRGELEHMWIAETLTSMGALEEAGSSVLDILLFPCDLRESLQRLLAAGGKISTSVAFILGGFPDDWKRTHALATSLAHETGAQGVCLAPVSEDRRGSWFGALLRGISHNHPLDLAIVEASRTLASAAGGRFPVPCFFATEQLLSEARLSSVVRQLKVRTAALAEAPIDVPEHSARVLSMAAGSHPAARISSRISESASGFAFASEAGEADAMARLSLSVARAEADSAVSVPEPRWIQAQLLDVAEPTAPSRVSIIESGKSYGVDVRIGPADSDWLAPSVIFPDAELPKNESGYWLQVVFSEAHHSLQPQMGRIFLPPEGASSLCRFFFRPVPDHPEFQARIIVLYENRVLQTALLEGRVADAELPGDRSEVTFRIEDAVRSHLSGLEYRQPFNASVVVNHTPSGQTMATSVLGDKARLFSLQNMEDAIGKIRKRLSDIAADPESFPRDINAPATVDLLRFLAHQGRTLYDAFEDQLEPGALERIDRLQLISALSESFLPLELLYEKPAPHPTAELCPKGKRALTVKAPKKGVCKECLIDDQAPAKYVCPLGFWSTTRVIERHVNRRLDTRLSAEEFALVAEPVGDRKILPTAGTALCGASSRVRASDTKAVVAALARYTGNKARQVQDWTGWRTEIGTTKPSLLVILCHTQDDPNLEIPEMEIGGDMLLSTLITGQHVRASQADPPPVVLLLGCESLCLNLPFQGFVPYLRRGGAAIVMTTIASVLGRHVAPVAKATVSLLKQELKKKGPHSFGELMPLLRRKALAQGIPMVFALAAYGDADWQLTM